MRRYLTGRQIVSDHALQPFQILHLIRLGRLVPLDPNTSSTIVPPWFKQEHDLLLGYGLKALQLKLDFMEWFQDRKRGRHSDDEGKWIILRELQDMKRRLRNSSHRTPQSE
jgi:hypothetical protein